MVGIFDRCQAKSLPVWEEWIEMSVRQYMIDAIKSLPVWEEWIEIRRRSARQICACVSSRMGRVD